MIFLPPPSSSHLRALLAVGTVMALISLSACSGGKDKDEGVPAKAAPPAQTTTSAPEPSPGGTTTTQGKPGSGAATINTQDVRH